MPVDAGSGNYVAVCSLCAWRDGPEISRAAAETLIESHRAAVHPRQFHSQRRSMRFRNQHK